jgi:hypothetical protein
MTGDDAVAPVAEPGPYKAEFRDAFLELLNLVTLIQSSRALSESVIRAGFATCADNRLIIPSRDMTGG